MRLRPRNVRSRLTLWYVLVLAALLALYAGVASLFLFLSLREDFDQNLLEDVETVEGMLAKEPNGAVLCIPVILTRPNQELAISSRYGRRRECCFIEVRLYKIRR